MERPKISTYPTLRKKQRWTKVPPPFDSLCITLHFQTIIRKTRTKRQLPRTTLSAVICRMSSLVRWRQTAKRACFVWDQVPCSVIWHQTHYVAKDEQWSSASIYQVLSQQEYAGTSSFCKIPYGTPWILSSSSLAGSLAITEDWYDWAKCAEAQGTLLGWERDE